VSKKLKKIYYVASTHWDREWYWPFQDFRFKMVKTINEVIDVLEKDEDFTTFILDGQTIVLDDFCQIETDKKEWLKKLITDKRIVVGPWYTMPDEFLTSGESLVRNLIFGRKKALEFGSEPMKFGYICDMFGHIAQMPQILNGCGIKGALLGRGTNKRTCPAFFNWKSPDGSSCVAFKVPEEMGYGTFHYYVLKEYLDGVDLDRENIIKRACRYIEDEMSRTDLPYVVLMDGMDHERIHPIAPWVAKRLSEIYGCKVVFESLESLVDDLKEYIPSMHVKTGELNETAEIPSEHNLLITNTLSSRYDIKKLNDICQVLLEKWAQPFSVMSAALGNPIQKTYIDLAYKYLITNHAHDSICGCSIDHVHQDMHYRFRQTKSIAENIIYESLHTQMPYSIKHAKGDTYVLTVFNPLPFARKETVNAEIYFDKSFSAKFQEPMGYELKNAFKIINTEGKEVPYNLIDIYNDKYVKQYSQNYRVTKDVYTVAIQVDMPPMGKTELKIVPFNRPVRYLEQMSTSTTECENEFIRLSINDNGTINIFDKQSSKNYTQLLSYLDEGEIGDGWFHVNPVCDKIVTSKGSCCIIQKTNDGPNAVSFVIQNYFKIPEKMEYSSNRISRSEEYKELKISSKVTLSKGNRWVDVETTVYNNVKDHVLKLVIPTGIKTDKYFVDQAFCFVERSTGFDRNTGEWKEHSVPEKSFESIVLKRAEDNTGLAFISAYGLHECAALDDEWGSINITLYRSFGKTFLTNGENDGQLQMPLTFKYRLVPVQPQDSFADLVRIKDCLQAGVREFTYPVEEDYEPLVGESLIDLEKSDIVLSTVKSPESGEERCLVIRLVNFSNKEAQTALKLFRLISKAYKTDLLGQEKEPADFSGNTLPVKLKAWQIQTYKIYFD
jgi:mannosylglycerate hydrolase